MQSQPLTHQFISSSITHIVCATVMHLQFVHIVYTQTEILHYAYSAKQKVQNPQLPQCRTESELHFLHNNVCTCCVLANL